MRVRPLLLSGLGLVEAFNISSRDASTDPRDFSWVQNWAAVGDSYVAGIGAGAIWNSDDDSYKCSRYDLSYVAQLNNYFPNVKNFRYLACSGDTTGDVYQQINQLPASSQDLIVIGAGGNDLCLSSLIWTCILSSQTTQAACDDIQAKSQSYIDSQFGDNVGQLIDNAVSKLGKDGIIVYSQYAQFFNAEADAPCHFDEDWVFPGNAGGGSLLLTTQLRANLNKLVINTNTAIANAIKSAQNRHSGISITTAAWDPWLDTVEGRFCEPFEKPNPDDPANKNAQFFKLDTTKRSALASTKRDFQFADNETAIELAVSEELAPETGGVMGVLGSSMSAAPIVGDSFAVSSLLQDRDPSPPACPKSGINLLPDNIGKIFHPTILGHLTLASFVSDAISVARAKIIGAPNPDCKTQNEFTCYSNSGSRAYAASYPLYASTEDFCNSAVKSMPKNTENWVFTKTYYDKTPDSARFGVQLSSGATTITYDQCHTAMNRILDGCDSNDPDNPLNFKFGGEWATSSVTFSIQPLRTNRIYPPYRLPIAKCDCWYHGLWDSFNVYGGGWGGWDFGKGGSGHGGGLFGNMTSCTGSWPSLWSFEYYKEPDADGYEWRAKANSVIWIKKRCLQPCIPAAGGPDHTSCDGNG